MDINLQVRKPCKAKAQTDANVSCNSSNDVKKAHLEALACFLFTTANIHLAGRGMPQVIYLHLFSEGVTVP